MYNCTVPISYNFTWDIIGLKFSDDPFVVDIMLKCTQTEKSLTNFVDTIHSEIELHEYNKKTFQMQRTSQIWGG